MYNVGLRKKRYILPGKLYEEKNTVFACFKTYVNYLYRSVLSSNGIICYCYWSKCYCFSHSRDSRVQRFFLSANRGGWQYFSVFHDPSTLKSILLVLLCCCHWHGRLYVTHGNYESYKFLYSSFQFNTKRFHFFVMRLDITTVTNCDSIIAILVT